MLTALSSNAILAKAKTMFGRRLTDQDYTDLLHCHTVTEVAAYLKKETAYARTFAAVNERNIHRGELEIYLKTKLLNDYAALCRYELSVGEHFSNYLIRRGEIEQILHCLRLLNAGKIQEYLFTLPVFFNSHTDLDLFALAKVRTFQEFLDALGTSKYREILEQYAPTEEHPSPDFALIENALFLYLFSGVFDVIKNHSRGALREELLEHFGRQVDFLNMLRIDRLKRHFGASPDAVRSMVMPFYYLIPPKVLTRMIDAESADAAQDIFRTTPYRKMMEKYPDAGPEDLFSLSMYDFSRKKMYFSTHPSVVMLSYISFMEIELENIIKIIEGIRYGLPKEELAGMIIGYKNKS